MEIEYTTIADFDHSLILNAGVQKRRKGNPATRKSKRKYKDLFCAFDIETTNDLDIQQSYMYIWQMQIEDQTIIGRSWDEFLTLIREISSELDEGIYLVVYVHNLSFEFSFLKGIYDFSVDEVFCTDRRKVLKCEMFDHIEFRCSYFLSNRSLDQFTKDMGVVEKRSGEEFDYSIRRYPWTVLSEQEMEYCIVDVLSLVQALKVMFSIYDDNFYSIPLTSTGFVRRDVKLEMRHFNRSELKMMLPDYQVFQLLREAFRGGNTHANRYYSGQIVDHVSSYDRVSSYPDVQMNHLFPMSPFIREDNVTIDRAIRKIGKHKRACVMRIAFDNIRLSDPMFGCPYIAKHKSRDLVNGCYDNGRVLYADHLEVTITDVDLLIILKQYDFDYALIKDFYHARYGKLPRPMRDCIMKYYQDKTKLKNIEGSELHYAMAKAKLNSIYGMTVQSPVKQNIDYIDDDFVEHRDDEFELLDKSNAKAFLSYAWGVWTTAHARAELETAIDLCGDRFVYCDIDSVKFIDDGKVDFSKYNKEQIRKCISNGAVAEDSNGHKYYLGLYDYEGTYNQFVTMGAKKYGYVDQDGELHITIAGVAKKKGAVELQKAGGLKMFRSGFTFYDAGGTEAVYNDGVDQIIIRQDQKIRVTSNVMIKPSTYTLGVTSEYKRIISQPAIWLDLLDNE